MDLSNGFTWISNIFTWMLMLISGIECSFSEIQKRQYQSKDQLMLIPQDEIIITSKNELGSKKIKVSDKKIDFLKDKNKEGKERRDRVDAKARTLLTLTSLLLGLVSSATSITSAKSIGLYSIIPLTLLFTTVFLLTIYFGIDTRQTIDYSFIFLDSNSESVKVDLCNDLLIVQDYNERVTNFLLDLYRSALRYFSLGMLCIMILGIGNIFLSDSSWIIHKEEVKTFIYQEISEVKITKYKYSYN